MPKPTRVPAVPLVFDPIDLEPAASSATAEAQYQRRQRAETAAAVVGVDTGKRTHALVVRPKGRPDSRSLEIPVTRDGFAHAATFIQRYSGGKAARPIDPATVLVGMEFAGVYGFTFAHYLRTLGYQIVSVPPRDTKNWGATFHGKRLKTDSADAATICDLTAKGAFRTFAFADPVYAQLRYLVSGYERVTKLRNGAVTRLRSVLQTVFPEAETLFGKSFTKSKTALAFVEAYPGPDVVLAAPKREIVRFLTKTSSGKIGAEHYDKIVTAARASLALPIAQEALRAEVPLLVEQIRLYTAQRTTFEAAMEAGVAGMPEAEALCTIPKLSAVTAAVFLGSIGDPRAYASARQVLNLAGLALTEQSSGGKQGTPHISKHGRAVLRRHAFLFAMRHVMRGGLYRGRFDAMVARGKPKMVALTAFSRDAVLMWHSVAVRRTPFYPASDHAAAPRETPP